ncbi:UNVERIFIED_CONTAM: hypothetical protein Scaly_1885100 [Sesamum calycinum]|uniref:Uncharacterized protein n=1 Tax=Sesamum calycinum TaxID=2727403 RepID=A0AAW2NEI9_9LAMI
MASAAAGRGAQTMNSMYFKPILRKAYHRKSGSPDIVSDTMKLNGEEMKHKTTAATGNGDATWWSQTIEPESIILKGRRR